MNAFFCNKINMEVCLDGRFILTPATGLCGNPRDPGRYFAGGPYGGENIASRENIASISMSNSSKSKGVRKKVKQRKTEILYLIDGGYLSIKG